MESYLQYFHLTIVILFILLPSIIFNILYDCYDWY
jgi:Trk-type K+ transport system membrane component